MADLKKKIDLYATVFLELLSDLQVIHPYDSKLKLLSMTVNGMIMYDKKGFVMTVIEYLEPYYDRILIKDQGFFLNDIENEFEGNSFLTTEIKRIKSIWLDPTTSDTTKESIWKYFTNLVTIGNLIKPKDSLNLK